MQPTRNCNMQRQSANANETRKGNTRTQHANVKRNCTMRTQMQIQMQTQQQHAHATFKSNTQGQLHNTIYNSKRNRKTQNANATRIRKDKPQMQHANAHAKRKCNNDPCRLPLLSLLVALVCSIGSMNAYLLGLIARLFRDSWVGG